VTRRALAGALLAPLLVAAACARWQPPFLRAAFGRGDFTQADLRGELAAYANRFAAVVASAADQIAEGERDPQVRKRTLLWKIRVVPLVREAALLEDPQQAYVSALVLAAMMRHYLGEGDGRDLFGARQEIATQAATQLEDDLVEIGARFLTPPELARLREEARAVAARNAIGGRDFAIQRLDAATREAKSGGQLGWVVDLPLAPFRALEGVESTAVAIHDFNDTALRFAQVVEALPEQMRWQTELLLYEAESLGSVASSLAALESAAESARLAARAIDRLPGDVRTLLADSEGSLAAASQALATAKELLAPLREAAEQVRLAGDAWAELGAGRERREPRERPFDVREWEAAAREIGTSAGALRELAVELRALAGSEEMDAALAGMDGALERSEASARGVIDHAAWRALQLLLAGFALVVLYRLAAPRLARRP
jgi:hypothetical protein